MHDLRLVGVHDDGEHLIFSIDDVEVTRVPVRDVASVCKGSGAPIASGE